MITKEELELHRKWLYNEDGGVRLVKIGADFAGAILRGANFAGAILENANFEGALLKNANLRNANFEGAIFEGANLIYTTFEGAYLRDTNFEDANLKGANFESADLEGANFEGADLQGAIGNQREIYSLQLPLYKIVMTKDRIYIGCQVHSKADWLKFDRNQLERMDGAKGLEWWDNYSKIVFELYDKTFEQIGEVL